MTKDAREETQKLLDSIGERIIAYAKNELCISAYYLSGAVAFVEEINTNHLANPLVVKGMATNGTLLVYDPKVLLSEFESDKNVAIRQYMHLLLHCIYRHYFKKQNCENRLAWDVACDIAAEYIIDDFEADNLKRDGIEIRRSHYDILKDKCDIMTAEFIYQELCLLSHAELKVLAKIFELDDHIMWIRQDGQNMQTPMSPFSPDNSEEGNGDALEPDPNNGAKTGPVKQLTQNEGDFDQTAGSTFPRGSDYEGMRNSAENWRRIAERIRLELEGFSNTYGTVTANLTRTIDIELKTTYDYRRFLRRFMVLKDILKEDPLEFDYIYYNLGLTMFGNVPLLDSLEYVLDYTLEEFVVAIDTSGSVFFDTVVHFLEECYSAIAGAQTQRRRIELHIIQCDAAVKEDVLITGFDDFTKYMKRFRLIGGGGTDFRPVFDHIAALQKKGELPHLKGIIYFTDGIGRFPDKPPKFDVAFVLYGEKGHLVEVPSWAMKLVIDQKI